MNSKKYISNGFSTPLFLHSLPKSMIIMKKLGKITSGQRLVFTGQGLGIIFARRNWVELRQYIEKINLLYIRLCCRFRIKPQKINVFGEPNYDGDASGIIYCLKIKSWTLKVINKYNKENIFFHHLKLCLATNFHPQLEVNENNSYLLSLDQILANLDSKRRILFWILVIFSTNKIY